MRAIVAVAVAATRAEPAASRVGDHRSARLSTALATAPVTNPSCTATVSSVPSPVLMPQSVRRLGTTAEAENQLDIASTCTRAMRPSWRRAVVGVRAGRVTRGV